MARFLHYPPLPPGVHVWTIEQRMDPIDITFLGSPHRQFIDSGRRSLSCYRETPMPDSPFLPFHIDSADPKNPRFFLAGIDITNSVRAVNIDFSVGARPGVAEVSLEMYVQFNALPGSSPLDTTDPRIDWVHDKKGEAADASEGQGP